MAWGRGAWKEREGAEGVDVDYAPLRENYDEAPFPIVFYAGADPVAVGLVESFRKPGGRLTGIDSRFIDLTAKLLELLKEMVPRLRRVVIF